MVNWLIDKLIILPGIIIGLSVHEFGHAWVAQLCGDDTAKAQGRVSLNPLDHIDWVGFISLIAFGFGWGRPVIINPRNFKKPRLNSVMVGLAGVFNNFICAWIFAFLLRLMYELSPNFFFMTGFGTALTDIAAQTVVTNLALMLFNLIPIPPLDGFGVISDIINLPRFSMKAYIWLRKYGQIILIIFIFAGGTGFIMTPPLRTIYNWIMTCAFSVFA